MNPNVETKTASAYLSGMATVFGGIEASGRDGSMLPLDRAIDRIIELLLETKGRDGNVMLIGNGGSAAIVSHIQNDLCKCIGIRALVFADQPLLTALANDDGYETVFEMPIKLWAQPGDVLVAVSSSGESQNILRAAAAAAARGSRVVTFSGFKPANRLRQLGEVNLYVPADTYGYVEMTHSVLGHCITDLARMRVMAQPDWPYAAGRLATR